MSKLFIELGTAEGHCETKFGNELIFISRIYSRFINKIKIENLNKISIQIEYPGFPNRIIPPSKLIKVCVFYKNFDWKILENEPLELNRYKTILDLILESILELAKKFNWPKEEFIKAYNEVCNTNFLDEFEIITPKFSKDKRFQASIKVNRNKDFCHVFTMLKEKTEDNEIQKIEILKTRFYEDNFSKIIKTLKWIDNDEFVVSNKDEEINFKYSIQTKKFDLLLTPKIHKMEYLQDELKLLNPFTSVEEFKMIINKRIQTKDL